MGSKGQEVRRLRGHACAFMLFNNKGRAIIFTESIVAHAIKTAHRCTSDIFMNVQPMYNVL